MAGTNMDTVISFAKEVVSAQQNACLQEIGGTAVSGQSGTDFGEYMKASVSAAEGNQNSRSAAKTVETKAEVAKTTEVEQVKNSEKPLAEETVTNQGQKAETQDTLDAVEAEGQEQLPNAEISQKLQESLKETGKMLEIPKDLKEAIAEIEEQLIQKIMEGFDITEDELNEALEVLAISVYDLLQTDNLKELAVYVSGEDSLVSLITNGDMYEVYKKTAAGIEEVSIALTESFSLTPEELQEVAAQLKNPSEMADSANVEGISNEEITMEIPEQSNAQAEAMTETKQPDILTEVSKTMEPAEKEYANEKVNEKAAFSEEGDLQLKGKAVETVTEDSGSQPKNDFASSSGGEEKKTAANSNENAGVQTNTSYTTVVTENQVQTVVKTQQTDFDGIVRQIVEQIKVEVKPDVSSMELQLNPENLGKVNLHVASKEGVITAQFFVQNETVKTMIEGQLAVLRDTMNAQGIKVEAVEVTVETGQFGRSLEQHSEQQKQEAEKQAKSYQHRAINLLAGLDEEVLDEEELLRAHIMRESGNSVDMNA